MVNNGGWGHDQESMAQRDWTYDGGWGSGKGSMIQRAPVYDGGWGNQAEGRAQRDEPSGSGSKRTTTTDGAGRPTIDTPITKGPTFPLPPWNQSTTEIPIINGSHTPLPHSAQPSSPVVNGSTPPLPFSNYGRANGHPEDDLGLRLANGESSRAGRGGFRSQARRGFYGGNRASLLVDHGGWGSMQRRNLMDDGRWGKEKESGTQRIPVNDGGWGNKRESMTRWDQREPADDGGWRNEKKSVTQRVSVDDARRVNDKESENQRDPVDDGGLGIDMEGKAQRDKPSGSRSKSASMADGGKGQTTEAPVTNGSTIPLPHSAPQSTKPRLIHRWSSSAQSIPSKYGTPVYQWPHSSASFGPR